MNRCCVVVTLIGALGAASSGVRADFAFSNFNSPAGLLRNGNAALFGDRLRVTPGEFFQRGSAWFTTQQAVQFGFDTTFQFQITGIGGFFPDPLGNPGADGLAFVIQNSSVTALGGYGGDMGYGHSVDYPGIANSLAVEFDMWFNPVSEFNDPNSNHISVHTRGLLPNSAHEDFSLGATTAIPDMSDGNVHTGRITYTPGSLSVFLDDLVSPRLTISLDLATTLSLNNAQAWVGFTSGTWNAWENHDVLNWSFTVIPEPATLALVAIGTLVLSSRARQRLNASP